MRVRVSGAHRAFGGSFQRSRRSVPIGTMHRLNLLRLLPHVPTDPPFWAIGEIIGQPAKNVASPQNLCSRLPGPCIVSRSVPRSSQPRSSQKQCDGLRTRGRSGRHVSAANGGIEHLLRGLWGPERQTADAIATFPDALYSGTPSKRTPQTANYPSAAYRTPASGTRFTASRRPHHARDLSHCCEFITMRWVADMRPIRPRPIRTGR